MAEIVIAGSGAAATAAALELVQQGLRPVMLDVGYTNPEYGVRVEENLHDYRRRHDSFDLHIGPSHSGLAAVLHRVRRRRSCHRTRHRPGDRGTGGHLAGGGGCDQHGAPSPAKPAGHPEQAAAAGWRPPAHLRSLLYLPVTSTNVRGLIQQGQRRFPSDLARFGYPAQSLSALIAAVEEPSR